MKTVFIVPDPYDNSKNVKYENVESLEKLLHEHFNGKCPENLHVYHGNIAVERDVTPKKQSQVEYLEKLNGTFYIVIYPAWLQIIYYAIVAIMAAYSVYTILTMPKSNSSAVGSSNNELSNRTNKARVKSRIPDIFGSVRAYPDLIAETYTIYENGIEIEECLMCIGRGFYQILDIRDGETDVANISGTSISVYDPDTSIVGIPIYQVGDTFTQLPKYVKKSDSINGQTLELPNSAVLESIDIWFESPNFIKSNNVDFTKYFSSTDRISLNNAVYGVDDVNLMGQILVTSNKTIVIESSVNIDNPSLFEGIQLTGALVNIVTTVGTPPNQTTETNTRDLSGQFKVSGITKTIVSSGYHYEIVLSSPNSVNPNWAYVNDNYTISAGAILNKNANSISLDATYTINSLTANTIALVNPSAINDEWNKLLTLPNQSTSGQTATVRFDIVSSKYVGWYNFEMLEATQVIFNFFFPNGLFYQDSKGGVWEEGMTAIIEIQSIDRNGNPVGAITKINQDIRANDKSQFGRTVYVDLQQKGPFRFRLSRTTATQAGKTQDTCKIKDVYASATIEKSIYHDVTVIRSKTVATDGALSVKERKLNCLVTRKLKVDGIGNLIATKDAGQALINLALDQYVGRRSAAEIDIEQIKAEIQAVKTYFGASEPTEFSYTFDDDSLSFEEQAGMIASACFCECYRFGNKLRLKFEKPQTNSVLLFNHRNKVPQSEKRTYNFGIAKDYDGIELEYTDPDDDARVTYTIPTDGSAINPQKITTSGIRNEAVAKTRAWREWNKLLYQRSSVEFDALDESNLLARNDRILVADNTLTETQDGEVVAQEGLTLTLSQNVDFEDGYTYYCFLQLSDGTVESIQCTAGEYTNQIVLVSAPSQALVTSSDRYVKTLYQVVKSTEAESQAFMLTELEPNDTMTNKLTAINYDARYYEKDHSFI